MNEDQVPVLKWNISLLGHHHDRDSFNCGVDPLNKFLKESANRNARVNVSRTFVATFPGSATQVAGFYTLSMAQLRHDSIPEKLSRKFPKYPIPAALIARLAVDIKAQGKGLGETLLLHGLQRITQLAKTEIGCALILVDAKNERAEAFYKKYGFISRLDQPSSLYLPMNTIETLFSGE
ncbi:GNAT family N-acetyltransferase [Bdellovibrionota bacterium FG-1]